jgi:hypothetical protein
MRRATPASGGPPRFFVSVAPKGVRSAVGMDSLTIRSVGAWHAVPVFPATALSTAPPCVFVTVASKRVKSTVGLGLPSVHPAGVRAFELRRRHSVPVFCAASVPFVGAQFIEPISLGPFPKRRCLTPIKLLPRAPTP